MATAADIIKGALRRLQVIGSETPIEDDEITDGIEDLNDFGNQLEFSTIKLGFVPVSLPADEVNIPIQAVGMYKDHLALYMAGQYGAPIPQTLVMAADESKRAVLNIFQKPIDVEFPDSLPVGSGNHPDITEDSNYFPANKDVNF